MTLLKELSSPEKIYKNMFVAARNLKELIADVVHSGLGMIANSGLIIKGKYAEPVEELMKLTPNKRHFYRHGIKAVTLIRQGS